MFVDPRLIVALITVIVGVGAVVITVQVINRNRLKEIAKQKAKNELSFKIKNCLKEGNCNFVNIGLLDTNQNETQENDHKNDSPVEKRNSAKLNEAGNSSSSNN